MKTFIITFLQTDKRRRDGWIRVLNAVDAHQVKIFADHAYKNEYSMIYEEEQFFEGYYPLGCLMEIDLTKNWYDYVT